MNPIKRLWIEFGRRRAIREYRRLCANYRPPPPPVPYAPIVHSVLMATPIMERLKVAPAVIAERVKYGGSPHWYLCPDESTLAVIEERLRPESFVTFYFDGRIEQSLDSPETKAKIERMLSETPKWTCLYVGFLDGDDEDGLRIDMMDFSSSDDGEFQEYEFTSTRPIFYGHEPGFDDSDGHNAISLMLPDTEGVIRPYKN